MPTTLIKDLGTKISRCEKTDTTTKKILGYN